MAASNKYVVQIAVIKTAAFEKDTYKTKQKNLVLNKTFKKFLIQDLVQKV